MKSVLFPLAIVGVWLLVIMGLSTSIGDWHHSQSIILATLGQLNPALAQGLSPDQLETLNFAARKLAHFSEYAILFSLAYWVCRSRFKVTAKIALPLVLASVILFAISDEFHQSFVPGRSPQVRDVLIDSLGASAVALICLKLDVSDSADQSSRDS